jgi:hypothetical protein
MQARHRLPDGLRIMSERQRAILREAVEIPTPFGIFDVASLTRYDARIELKCVKQRATRWVQSGQSGSLRSFIIFRSRHSDFASIVNEIVLFPINSKPEKQPGVEIFRICDRTQHPDASCAGQRARPS